MSIIWHMIYLTDQSIAPWTSFYEGSFTTQKRKNNYISTARFPRSPAGLIIVFASIWLYPIPDFVKNHFASPGPVKPPWTIRPHLWEANLVPSCGWAGPYVLEFVMFYKKTIVLRFPGVFSLGCPKQCPLYIQVTPFRLCSFSPTAQMTT